MSDSLVAAEVGLIAIASGLLRLEEGAVALRDSGFVVGDPLEEVVGEDVVFDDS